LLTSEDLEQVPKRYRWLLKLFLRLPNPRFPYFLLRKLPEIEGFFWALIVPVFLLVYFLFSFWLFVTLSRLIVFPLDFLIGFSIPAIIFVLFLRIQLGRTLAWWKSLKHSSRKWQVSEVLDDLVELFEKQQKNKRLN
jgi:hypothetical protein